MKQKLYIKNEKGRYEEYKPERKTDDEDFSEYLLQFWNPPHPYSDPLLSLPQPVFAGFRDKPDKSPRYRRGQEVLSHDMGAEVYYCS